MRFFDLHCDTIYRGLESDTDLFKNDFHVSIQKALNFDSWIQCFAIWIPDDLSREEAYNLFNRGVQKFNTEINRYADYIAKCTSFSDIKKVNDQNKFGAILTLEGSNALNGDLENILYMKECGVKIITLTWNGETDIGSGCQVLNPRGLSKFGKKAIKRMNENNIVVDVSHASDKLFYDVAEMSSKPIIATHSNSRKICGHKRNLTDDQFKTIVSMNGLVGINFCDYFLSSNKTHGFMAIKKHIDHFLTLSGEKTVCIGSDFDGADMPIGISGIESIEELYENLLKSGYKESLLEDIFFNNAYNFFKKME